MLANAEGRRYVSRMSICYINSPVGRLALEADDDCVTGMRWAGPGERARAQKASPVLKEGTRQLDRYLGRKLRRFDLPLASTRWQGTMMGSGLRPHAVPTARGPEPSAAAMLP